VPPIRALVVDDSVVARKLVSEILSSDPAIEVAGTAANASIAMQKIDQLTPNIVILDVVMPETDGLETAKKIRAAYPKLPVLLFSSVSENASDMAARARACGANGFIAKPTTGKSPTGSLSMPPDVSVFASELVQRVKALTSTPASSKSAAHQSLPPSTTASRGAKRVTAIAIGSSTGGPNALSTIFQSLPRDLNVPIFIVQHMLPTFSKILAERLTTSTGFPVIEACHGDRVEAGRAYIAPGDQHMSVRHVDSGDIHLALDRLPPECSVRPAIDVLFRSVAAVYGNGVLAAVLTGMGTDGSLGAEAIAAAGGSVIVQDESSSVIASMPSAVMSRVAVDGVYAIDRMAGQLARRVRGGRGTTTGGDFSR
jgi:two-component system chemotaxis response regulator CheB